jgi:triphosphoribosyl-dephospho-CoA synthase
MEVQVLRDLEGSDFPAGIASSATRMAFAAAASGATHTASIFPMPEPVWTEVPPTVQVANAPRAPVGAASAATNAAQIFQIPKAIGAEAQSTAPIPNATPAPSPQANATGDAPSSASHAHRLGRFAVASLHAELACAHKPGLVTPFDRGSHEDMDAGTFMRSLFALRGYFVAIAAAGAADAPFATLRELGIDAERAMLRATGGINTHRGAIFSLGLLVAAAARLRSSATTPLTGEAVCDAVAPWRDALLDAPLDPHSHGQRMRRLHGVAGVREQAAAGFPLLREVALPTLRGALRDGLGHDAAMAQTLLHLIARTDDLNLLHRGGRDGLRFAQRRAHAFLAAGGVRQPDWRTQLVRLGAAFVARRLSPGGSADLLACAWFLQRQEQP